MNTAPTTAQPFASLLLWNFAHQRPGVNVRDYGDIETCRREVREINADLHDFRALYQVASRLLGDKFDYAVQEELEKTSGRLELKAGKLHYCTGQYFPTEYRPAANRILANVIWYTLRKDYQTGDQIRKAAARLFSSRRVLKYYFN